MRDYTQIRPGKLTCKHGHVHSCQSCLRELHAATYTPPPPPTGRVRRKRGFRRRKICQTCTNAGYPTCKCKGRFHRTGYYGTPTKGGIRSASDTVWGDMPPLYIRPVKRQVCFWAGKDIRLGDVPSSHRLDPHRDDDKHVSRPRVRVLVKQDNPADIRERAQRARAQAAELG